MPDHDAKPDPIDKAYAQAEAVLDDERARAARRARVLAAVAGEPAAAPDVSTATPRRLVWARHVWARGGWLVAASVAGLSALLLLQVNPPTAVRQPPAPPTAAVPAPAPKAETSPARTPKPAPSAPAVAARAEPTPPSAGFAAAPPPVPPPPAQAARPAAPPAEPMSPTLPATAPRPSDRVEEAVVTGSRVAARLASPKAAAAQPKSAEGVSELVVTSERRRSADEAGPAAAESPAMQARRLRRAAASGRVDEISALLEAGAEVDAPDGEGVTALMRAVQRRHAEAALLLRNHGADLDRKTRAGVSARDMAAKLADPELNRALGLSL